MSQVLSKTCHYKECPNEKNTELLKSLHILNIFLEIFDNKLACQQKDFLKNCQELKKTCIPNCSESWHIFFLMVTYACTLVNKFSLSKHGCSHDQQFTFPIHHSSWFKLNFRIRCTACLFWKESSILSRGENCARTFYIFVKVTAVFFQNS